MEISAARQEIVVEESSVVISTANSQMQSSVESKAITQLSQPSGVLWLAGTTHGVIPVAARNPFLGQGSVNSNGGRGNNITIDNANATDVSATATTAAYTKPAAAAALNRAFPNRSIWSSPAPAAPKHSIPKAFRIDA